MCHEYHMNLDDFLETKIPTAHKSKKYFFLFDTTTYDWNIFHA